MKKWTSLLEISLEIKTSRNQLRYILKALFKAKSDYKLCCGKIYVNKKTYKLIKKIYKVVK